MKFHPAIEEAKILVHYGRAKQAERLLRVALDAEPGNAQLEEALKRLQGTSGPTTRPASHSHQLVGWLLLLLPLLICLAAELVAIRHFGGHLPDVPSATLYKVIYFVLLLACAFTPLILSMYLFFWLWFSYLKRLPAKLQEDAEASLARAMNLLAFEPQYSRVRTWMLGRARTDA
jgi:hypothetical protein